MKKMRFVLLCALIAAVAMFAAYGCGTADGVGVGGKVIISGSGD